MFTSKYAWVAYFDFEFLDKRMNAVIKADLKPQNHNFAKVWTWYNENSS